MTRTRTTLLLATVGALAQACEPSVTPEPESAFAVETAPLESVYSPFTVTGRVRVGRSACPSGVARPLSTVDIRFRDSAGSTVYSDATVTALEADLARAFSASPQRDIDGTLLRYAWRNSVNGSAYARIFYGGTSGAATGREFRYAPPEFDAPPTGTNAIVQDVTLTNLTSLEVELSMPWASDQDDVVRITTSAAPTSGTPATSLFNTPVCRGDGVGCTALVAGDTVSSINGYIRTYLPAGGPTTSQRLSFEMLLIPGRTYTLTVRIELRDGFTITRTVSSLQADACGQLALTPATHSALAFARAPQSLSGSLFLESAEYLANPTLGGPRPTGYYATFYNATNTSTLGYTASGGQLLLGATTDGTTPVSYQWNGASTGRYRTDRADTQAAPGWLDLGHVRLGWGSEGEPLYRPPFRAVVNDTGSGPAFQALYRWPRAGATPVGETLTNNLGLDASGHFYIDANESQVVNRRAPMSYLLGQVAFLGCGLLPTNIASGVAEFEGVGTTAGASFNDEKGTARTAVVGNFEAFARGLFRDGTKPEAAADPGGFEVALTAGEWRARAFRMRLAGVGAQVYDGDLMVWPTTTATHQVGTGRAGQNTDLVTTPVELQVTKIGVDMRAPAGSLMRNVTLQIGSDSSSPDFANRVPYRDLLGATRGAFTASSFDGVSGVETWSPVIVAMANSTVTIQPRAEVSTDGGSTWTLNSFPPLTGVELSGSCGQCILDATTSVDDDGQPPTLTLGAVATQPPGTTSVTISGTASDAAVPVTAVLVNGTPLAVTPGANSQTFSVEVDVAAGENTVTVVARDCVGNAITSSLTFDVQAPLCEAAATPTMCQYGDNGEAPPGAAFYVDLVDPEGAPRSLYCTVAGPGQAPVCDTQNLLAPQCGN